MKKILLKLLLGLFSLSLFCNATLQKFPNGESWYSVTRNDGISITRNRVGILTITPSYTLDVNGTMNATNYLGTFKGTIVGNVTTANLALTANYAERVSINNTVNTANFLANLDILVSSSNYSSTANYSNFSSTANNALNKQVALTATPTKTSDYTANPFELISCDISGGSFKVTLPSAPADGTIISVKLNTIGKGKYLTIATSGTDKFNTATGTVEIYMYLFGEFANVQYDSNTGLWNTFISAATYNWATNFPGVDCTTPITNSDITINNTTRVLTITPPLGYFNIFVDGDGVITRYRKVGTIDFPEFTNTTGTWFFYFDVSGNAITTQTPWDVSDFATIVTVYRLVWDASLPTENRAVAQYVEYHCNDISFNDHQWFHLQGTQWVNGFSLVSNILSSGAPSTSGNNTVVGLTTGTNVDDNLSYTVTNTTNVSSWSQDLGMIYPNLLTTANSAQFKTFIFKGGNTIGFLPATRFPFPWNSATNIPYYIDSAGVTTSITNGNFMVVFIYATQNPMPGEAIKSATATSQFTSLINARAYTWTDFGNNYPTIIGVDNEIRPLYRLIYEVHSAAPDVYDANVKYSVLREYQDLRKIAVTSTTAASGTLPASSVTVVPAGNITATNAQSALQQLDTLKSNVNAPTVVSNNYSGSVVINGNLTATAFIGDGSALTGISGGTGTGGTQIESIQLKASLEKNAQNYPINVPNYISDSFIQSGLICSLNISYVAGQTTINLIVPTINQPLFLPVVAAVYNISNTANPELIYINSLNSGTIYNISALSNSYPTVSSTIRFKGNVASNFTGINSTNKQLDYFIKRKILNKPVVNKTLIINTQYNTEEYSVASMNNNEIWINSTPNNLSSFFVTGDTVVLYNKTQIEEDSYSISVNEWENNYIFRIVSINATYSTGGISTGNTIITLLPSVSANPTSTTNIYIQRLPINFAYVVTTNTSTSSYTTLAPNSFNVYNTGIPYPNYVLSYWEMDSFGSEPDLLHSDGTLNFTAVGKISTTPGKIGSARGSFSGSQYFIIQDNNVFESQTFAIEAWIKTSVRGASQGIFTHFNGANNGYALTIRTDNKADMTYGGVVNNLVASSATLTDGNWHYIVFANLATSGVGNARMYVDGILNSQANGAAFSTSGLTNPILVGTATVGAAAFQGLIDSVAYWNTMPSSWAIFENIIQQRYALGLARKYGGNGFSIQGNTTGSMNGSKLCIMNQLSRNNITSQNPTIIQTQGLLQ